MPVHRCAFDDLEQCVESIERSNSERIVGVVPHGDAVAIVTYVSERAKPRGVERR